MIVSVSVAYGRWPTCEVPVGRTVDWLGTVADRHFLIESTLC